MEKPWLEIDLGAVATLGGLELYWGHHAPAAYDSRARRMARIGRAFVAPDMGKVGRKFSVSRRQRLGSCAGAVNPERRPGPEIVQINIYGPADAVSTLEAGRVAVLGHAPVRLAAGDSITVDLGYIRSVVGGTLVDWASRTAWISRSTSPPHREGLREVGRIATGEGQSDTFWWPCAMSRYLRLTLHAASAPEGAIVNELKLRILDRDRMPIGQVERAARAGRGDLYPQSLLGRQVYWTVVGEFGHSEEALFDEYGNLEPRRGSAQITPLLRMEEELRGAPAAEDVRCFLEGGSLPIPSVVWSMRGLELRATALAHAGQALVEYRVTNHGREPRVGSLVLAVRPVQINPYWQHGGHTLIDAIAVEGRQVLVNDKLHSVFSREPDIVTVAEFDNGDVIRLIENGARATEYSLRSESALLSAALEFSFSLAPGASAAVLVAAPLREGVTPDANVAFSLIRKTVADDWRRKLGPRRITVGDREVTETVEAQTCLILVNATRSAFKPGPRNYDRVWIRDGSAQALALLWAGLVEEAQTFVLWYAKRIHANGMVPPILDEDGAVNRGYGSDIEFDAQGEFVCIAAETGTASPGIAPSWPPSWSPSSARHAFLMSFANEPMRGMAENSDSTAFCRLLSVTRAMASRLTAIGTISLP